MKYRLEWVTNDDVLIVRLISIRDGEIMGAIESEIVIPLESLQPQGRK